MVGRHIITIEKRAIAPNNVPFWRDPTGKAGMKTIKDLPEHSRSREKLREKSVFALTDEKILKMW